MKQLAFDFSAVPSPTLDNFIAGRNPELVQRLRRSVYAQGDERFLYLWGAPASGRSHLLHGWLAAHEAAGSRVAYAACAADTRLAENLHEMHAVAIDDVQRLGGAGQADLFKLYNALRDAGKTLLAAGDVAPMRLDLRADVVTRLAWGLVYEVQGLTDLEKAEALAGHAAARGFMLQADVAQYLLTRARRDMPALLAMIDALDRYSLEAKRPVTVPLLRQLLDKDKA